MLISSIGYILYTCIIHRNKKKEWAEKKKGESRVEQYKYILGLFIFKLNTHP